MWLALVASVAASRADAYVFECNSDTTAAAPEPSPRFYHFRAGQKGLDLVYRDVEFMWDSLYVRGVADDSVAATLARLAHTLVDSTGRNPLRVPWGDFRLVYDYFRRQGSSYTLDPKDTNSVVVGLSGASGYKPSDRSHVDCYIVDAVPRGWNLGGASGGFTSEDEDVTTDHALGEVKGANAISVAGPTASRMLDVNGTGWAAPDSAFNPTFMHEFQHILPPGDAGTTLFRTEMFSAIAEGVSGAGDSVTVGSEVPYTWSLLAAANGASEDTPCNGAGPGATCVRAMGSNYQARSLFGPYLVYNFRGADTTATSISDDLVLAPIW
jgi:hypothetical protein